MTPYIVTITGPSCAGKSTLEARLRNRGFESLISTTTRDPRQGEANGESYYFVSHEEFQRSLEKGDFVEHATFNGERYGVSVAEVQRVAAMGKPIVVVLEPNGLRQIQKYGHQRGWPVVSVFLNNPSSVIAKRFIDRCAADFVLSLAKPGNAGKVLDSYSRRLCAMLEEERYWEEDVGPYCEYWLHHFDESNVEETVDVLCRRAQDYLGS